MTALLLGCLLSGCAIVGDVVQNPEVGVLEVKSVWITPAQWKLEVYVRVKNKNPLTLSFSRAACSVFVESTLLETKVLASLPVVPAYETQIIVIPLLLDLAKIEEKRPASGKMPLLVSGQLSPNEQNQPKLVYESLTHLALPLMPVVNKARWRQQKKTGVPMLVVRVKNDNTTPLTLQGASGYVQAGTEKYKLTLAAKKNLKLGAGQYSRILLLAKDMPVTALKEKQPLLATCEFEFAGIAGKIIIPWKQARE